MPAIMKPYEGYKSLNSNEIPGGNFVITMNHARDSVRAEDAVYEKLDDRIAATGDEI